MEAANKGAQSINGISCGVGIEVPMELETNRFIDHNYRLRFRYFFIRKVMFVKYAQACVFLPGGFGSLDELFETLTLIQTNKIRKFPIYLMGKSYWQKLKEWMANDMIELGCISEQDLALLKITDDPEEVANGIERHYQANQQLENF